MWTFSRCVVLSLALNILILPLIVIYEYFLLGLVGLWDVLHVFSFTANPIEVSSVVFLLNFVLGSLIFYGLPRVVDAARRRRGGRTAQ